MAFSFSFFLLLCIALSHCAAPNNVSNTNQMSRHVSHLMQRTLCVCCVCPSGNATCQGKQAHAHSPRPHTWYFLAVFRWNNTALACALVRSHHFFQVRSHCARQYLSETLEKTPQRQFEANVSQAFSLDCHFVPFFWRVSLRSLNVLALCALPGTEEEYNCPILGFSDTRVTFRGVSSDAG